MDMKEKNKKLGISEAASALTFLHTYGEDFDRIEDIEGGLSNTEIKRKILPKKAFKKRPKKVIDDFFGSVESDDDDFAPPIERSKAMEDYKYATDIDGNKLLVVKGAYGISYEKAREFKNKRRKKGVRAFIRIKLTGDDLRPEIDPAIDATDVALIDTKVPLRLSKIADKIIYEDLETHSIGVLLDRSSKFVGDEEQDFKKIKWKIKNRKFCKQRYTFKSEGEV